jgi:hypothetical protein
VTRAPGPRRAEAAQAGLTDAADQIAPAARVLRLGRAGLAGTALSVALTFAVAVLGPSLMEPALPGRPGQPPWSFLARPSPYLVVALTAAAIVAGTAGLGLTVWAARRGWRVSPGWLLAAGIVAAVALALVPPFGSSDHLSYAAYGRMAATGHDPYTTTPAALARLGDRVARAVQDFRSSPSVYGALASGGQALASAIGGTSVRLTVFVLSVLNVLAFAVTGLLLHGLARRDRGRQLRAALLWTANPLLLQVLVAGAHVDSQAIVFAVAALAAFALAARQPRGWRQALAAGLAGALVGLGFAVKATMVLAGLGLALACLLAARRGRGQAPGNAGGLAVRRWAGRVPLPLAGGLAAGFAVTAGASLAVWGVSSLRPALSAGSYVSIGSPWRAVRSALRVVIGEGPAEDAVKIAAVALAVVLLLLMLRAITGAGATASLTAEAGDPAGSSARARGTPETGGCPDPHGPDPHCPAALAGALAPSIAVAVVVAWLFAWPYVLPWYDGIGWALLVLLPWSGLDWLLLARTAALAIGYLPARGSAAALPAGLGWLQTVVRTGVTPVILLACTVTLIAALWPGRGWRWPDVSGWRSATPFRSQ